MNRTVYFIFVILYVTVYMLKGIVYIEVTC